MQFTPIPFLLYPTPLFKEKRNSCGPALLINRVHPRWLHSSSPNAALPADDHPMYISKIQCAQILQQRFYRKKPHSDCSFFQFEDSWDSISLIFHAHAPPNMVCASREAKLGIEQMPLSFRSFGQDLVRMPICFQHHMSNSHYV